MSDFDLAFPFALGAPSVSAQFRQHCEDFVVNEVLGFSPSGEGEHLLLEVLKRDDNTPWIAKQIARIAGVQPMDVGYCGLKDRRAVTRQWFSVYLPQQSEIDWQQLNSDTAQLLAVHRHHKKLRRGEHQANEFIIRLRDCQGDLELLETRLNAVSQSGVPNYFGEQRFGREASNLHEAATLFATSLARDNSARKKGGRRKGERRPGPSGMVLSAARSWLFNQVLAARVERDLWREPMAGETTELSTGPLWGRGRNGSAGELLALETEALAPWSDWCHGLEHAGLAQERRPLVLRPMHFTWDFDGPDLTLSFTLAPGQFATAVLRELCRLEIPAISAD
ncbi:tRNA pseudouridine(13) synthase TruD [Simiduia aestuariiviva]|uniref:tRNA pseudouridine synthase D n=1 Tax=Simiduia aestuariiviva TaxID=1510459 RepID=A0A839UQW4_9GAMM|nr:tRNA pseudouridine13 synthase [Simiduia aestuariiviva]